MVINPLLTRHPRAGCKRAPRVPRGLASRALVAGSSRPDPSLAGSRSSNARMIRAVLRCHSAIVTGPFVYIFTNRI